MIKTNIGQTFILTSVLEDESTGQVATGETVYYDIRKQPGDTVLSPAVTGTLIESSIEPGVYRTNVTLNESGNFVSYITCSGFYPGVENISVDDENITDLVKQNRHYNISVEDVVRTTETPTANQVTRNVPLNRTDYVVTKIKPDGDLDWSGDSVVQNTVYAWYTNNTDTIPYKMGEQG